MPQRVREQVEQHALHLLRLASNAQVARDAGGEADTAPAGVCLDAAQAGLDHRLEAPPGTSSASARSRSGRARTGRRRATGVTCSRSTGRSSSGSTRPSSRASSIACMLASGVRRSWLAHATSSRRASNSCSRLAAISLNDEARSATSAGPRLGRAHREVAAREPRRRVADTLDGAHDRSGENQAGDDGDRRGGSRDGEDLHVVSHVEHQPSPRAAPRRAAGRRRAWRARRAAGGRLGRSRSASRRNEADRQRQEPTTIDVR